jgi:hypothetical protein
MAVQHRDLVIDARTPPALPRWRVRERAAAPECRLLPILRAGIDPAAPVWNLPSSAWTTRPTSAWTSRTSPASTPEASRHHRSSRPGIAAYQESVEAGGVREHSGRPRPR